MDFFIHCHSIDISFNTHIFIQYITFCSIPVDSFNGNILIQLGYIHSMRIYYSMQKYWFNMQIYWLNAEIYLFDTNFVHSIIMGLTRPSHMTYCVFRGKIRHVKVDFHLSCKDLLVLINWKKFHYDWRAIDIECLKSSLRVDLPTKRRPAFSGLLDIFEIAVVSLGSPHGNQERSSEDDIENAVGWYNGVWG